MKSLLRSAFDVLLDRVLGPPEKLLPGDRCRVLRSVVAANNGVLLQGTLVEVTGVMDPKGRMQVRVVDIPDRDWDETTRLPYGPGFVIYVDPDCLGKE